MDFVDEKECPLPRFPPRARRIEHLLEICDAGKDRGNLFEVKVCRLRQQARDGGFADARWTPEDQRAKGARVEEQRECAIGREQMVLPDHLRELLRPQPIGERPWRVMFEPCRREQIWPPALGAWRHPRSSTDICWPPRMMVMRHSLFCWFAIRSRSRVFAIFALLTDSTRSPRWNPRL